MSSTPPTFPPPEPPTEPGPRSGLTSSTSTDDAEQAEPGRAHRTRRVAVGAAVLAGAALAGVVVVDAARSDDAVHSTSEPSNDVTTSNADVGSLDPLVPSSGTDDGTLDPGRFGTGDAQSDLGEWDDGPVLGGLADGGLRPGHPERGAPGGGPDAFGTPPDSDGGALPTAPTGDTWSQPDGSSTGATPAAPSGSPDTSTRGS